MAKHAGEDRMPQKRIIYTEMQRKRAAYAAFEKTIIDLYDRKLLTLDRLDLIADQYSLLKPDNVGSQSLVAHDGKDMYQVCIQLVDPAFPLPSRGSSRDDEEYWEQEIRKWEDIVRWRWNWYSQNATTFS
jgi:hypothetical protein